MKTIILNLVIIITLVLVGFQAGIYFGDNRTYTEKMQDCVSKGGKYYLSVKESSNWNYETCEIETTIKY